jgi:hypothetical protein
MGGYSSDVYHPHSKLQSLFDIVSYIAYFCPYDVEGDLPIQ